MANLSGAALDRQTRGLVQDENCVIPIQCDRLEELPVFPHRSGRPFLRASRRERILQRRFQRWDTDHLAGREPVPGLHPFTIDPYLAGAQEFLQPAVTQLRESLPEPAVEPLVAVGFRNGVPGYRHRYSA